MNLRNILVAVLFFSVGFPSAQAADLKEIKYGALAIDRTNGFVFAWAYDHPTRESADQYAINEGKKRSANVSIVLSWGGPACAAYRTVAKNSGTAYGWGVASTREEADRIAMHEAAKRSNGQSTPNFVWACNSGNGKLKVFYDAGPEIFSTTTIGGKLWSAENLNVVKFRNGDPIPQAKTVEEFFKMGKEKKPAFIEAQYCSGADECNKQGKFYNGYAVADPRGLAPYGWKVASLAEWSAMIDGLGGMEAAGPKMRDSKLWPSWAKPANNESGISILPAYYIEGSFLSRINDYKKDKELVANAAFFWTSTVEDDTAMKHVSFRAYDSGDEVKAQGGSQYKSSGLSVRLVKE